MIRLVKKIKCAVSGHKWEIFGYNSYTKCESWICKRCYKTKNKVHEYDYS